MASSARAIQWTYEDYLAFPEDGKRYEIIEGDCFMSPAPRTRHQRIAGKLFTRLSVYLQYSRVGEAFIAPTDVVLSDINVVEPDILVILAQQLSIITEKNIQGAPDLVIEILSETTRKTDEIVKKKLYERYGVLEYWIVDPDLALVKIYRLTDGRYGRAEERAEERGETVTTVLLPGLDISLTELFE